MNPLASIITLTYNKPEYILKLKESLEKTIDLSIVEWIVVDNGSDKETSNLLKPLSWVKYIKHDNRGNFSSMNNMAVKEADSDNLIFLNNDMESKSDFVERMTTILNSHESIGCVGAVLTYPDYTLQHAGVIFTANAAPANLGNKAIIKLKLNIDKVNPDLWENPIEFKAVTGACLAIKRHDFMLIQGFHEEFSWAYEDVDLCLRVRLHLNKITLTDPLSRLIHHESVSGGERQITKNLSIFSGRYRHLLKADFHRFI